MIYTTLYPQ